MSPQRNSPGALSVEYPAGAPGFTLIRDSIGAQPPRALEVEVWLGGSATGALRGYLLNKGGDSLTPGDSWSFSGHFLEWLLSKAVVAAQTKTEANPKGDLTFAAATYGTILATVVQQAQARGALPGITRDFTTTHDSNGVAWAASVTNLSFSPKTTVLQVAEKGVELELGEFYMTAGRVLRAFNPGTRGVDRTTGGTPLTFAHAINLREHARRETARDAGTAVLAAGGEGLYAWATNATALASLGFRAEVAADAGQISTPSGVTAFAASQAEILSKGVAEYASTIELRASDPRPLLDYGVGDWGDAVTGTERKRLRIAQIDLAFERGRTTVTVVQNDVITDALAALYRRLNAITSGDAVVGTSVETPGGDTDTLAPAAPTGLVASSLAYQDVADGDTYASITLGWSPVTTNTDATAADDVAGYRVQLAYLGLNQVGPAYTGAPDPTLHQYEVTPAEGTTATSFTFGGVGAGASVQVQVRAFDRVGNHGPWSAALQFTTQDDNTAPPTASKPTVGAWFRTVDITWNGLGSVGEPMPLDFSHVEVHLSTAAVYTPSSATQVAQLNAAGTWNEAGLPPATTYYARLVAVDRAGNKAAASAVSNAVTTQRLLADDVGEQLITAAMLADNQPLGPKIGAEQIRTSHLTVAAMSDNLLPNGGFEDVALSGSLPASWLQTSSSGGTHTFTRNATAANVHSGAASAQLTMSAASGALIIGSETIPCRPGDTFYVEISAKASRPISGLTVLLGIGDTDPAGVAFPSLVNNAPLTTAFPAAPLGLNYTVPPTVGAGVVPKYLRLLVRGGAVVGDAAAVTFWVDEIRIRKVVGRAEIADAAIGRAQLGLLAAGEANIETVNAGSIVTGTMTATVTNSGIFQTASSGSRLRFDSSGLLLYNASNVLVGRWNTSDASILVTGTYQSGLSGKRIMIEPDGDFKLYPPAGSNFSSMTNNGNDVIWRGPLDSNSRSGRFNVNTIGGGINFSSEGELGNLRAEVLVLDRQVGLTAPNHVIRLNGRHAPIPGQRYLDVLETNASGVTIPSTVLRFRNYSAVPGHVAPGQNAGFKYEASTCAAVDNTGLAYCNVTALSYGTASSRLAKRGEADIAFRIRDLVLDELDVIELAPARSWQYLSEQRGSRQAKPGITVEAPRLGPSGGAVLDEVGRPIVDTYEADWDWPEPEAPTHYGPMAEDLERVAPSLVRRDLGGPGELITDLRDLVGVQWGALGKLSRRLRAVEAELAAVRPAPTIVDGDVA